VRDRGAKHRGCGDCRFADISLPFQRFLQKENAPAPSSGPLSPKSWPWRHHDCPVSSPPRATWRGRRCLGMSFLKKKMDGEQKTTSTFLVSSSAAAASQKKTETPPARDGKKRFDSRDGAWKREKRSDCFWKHLILESFRERKGESLRGGAGVGTSGGLPPAACRLLEVRSKKNPALRKTHRLSARTARLTLLRRDLAISL